MPRPYRMKSDDDRGKRLKPNRAPDTSGETVPLPAKVPPALKEWVREYGESVGKSNSQIVREALELYRSTVNDQ